MPRFTVAPRLMFAVCLVIAAAAAITGCGVGAGPGARDASLLVTTDFGTNRIGEDTEKQVPGAETVMSLLERHFRVGTRYGGGFVESIDGHRGSSHRLDWFYFVNGIEAGKGAAATDIRAGDHIWWDLHSWAAAESVPAVVGSYPEPFTSTVGGRKLVTVRECAADMQSECDLVGDSLRRFGIRSTEQSTGARAASDGQAVVIGAWSQIKGIKGAALIAGGPADSGVYAHFVGGDGATLALEDPAGAVARSLRGSVGLIAATQGESPGTAIWLVTGTDAAGVMAAARAFTVANLEGHFAIAVDATRVIPLPVDASS